eukprot:15065-Pleurochrysis_carterae.AAC.1
MTTLADASLKVSCSQRRIYWQLFVGLAAGSDEQLFVTQSQSACSCLCVRLCGCVFASQSGAGIGASTLCNLTFTNSTVSNCVANGPEQAVCTCRSCCARTVRSLSATDAELEPRCGQRTPAPMDTARHACTALQQSRRRKQTLCRVEVARPSTTQMVLDCHRRR